MPLLYVLWTVGLITIIAGAMQLSGTVSYKQARNAAEAARQEALAEAALNRIVLTLLDRRDGKRVRVDGVPQTLSFDDMDIKATIRDEVGRIDINHTEAPLLAGLLRAAGERAEDAEKIADRILDWRDADSLTRLNGAEARQYRDAGASLLPRDAPFQTVEELKHVLGMTPDIFRRIEPAITIYSGRPVVDPMVSMPLIQSALQGQAPAASRQEPASSASRPVFASWPPSGRAFVISIEFKPGDMASRREAIIRMTGDAAKPYWLLRWRQR
jgi:general secretion pathway protein K